MPIELTNIPTIFQVVVNKALFEYLDIFILIYLDDILVYSSGILKDYIIKVKLVLVKLQKFKLLLQLDKYKFHVKKTKYLGYIILEDRITIDLKKVKIIQN